jgi:hypothetical protein
MDAVSSLMQERQRFEAWLASLESKRAITPPHVYERVRGDYEARLREVIQQLSGRTTELKETVAALTARMSRLQSEENAKRDERYEAELRATVGEFETDKWEKLRNQIDDTITRLTGERAGVSTELARIQQILSMAGNAANAAAVEPPRAPDAGRPQGGRFDELAFLSSVVDPGSNGGRAGQSTTGGAGSPGHSAPAASPPPAAPPPSAAAPAPTEPPSAAPARGVPATRQPEPAPVGGRTTGSNPAQPVKPSVDTTNAVPSYLRDVPKESTKTLKCAECGTMNYATEWYCERCGGELAAM